MKLCINYQLLREHSEFKSNFVQMVLNFYTRRVNARNVRVSKPLPVLISRTSKDAYFRLLASSIIITSDKTQRKRESEKLFHLSNVELCNSSRGLDPGKSKQAFVNLSGS